MKMLRYLFAIVLVFGLTSAAKAAGFQMVVVDPTVPLDVIQQVTSDDFVLNFPTAPPAEGCDAPGQLPGGNPGGLFVDCFTGINLTGKPLTSLEIELPTLPFGGGGVQPSCPALTGAGGDFKDVTCTTINGGADFLFDFTDGDIVNATPFNSLCFFDPFDDPGIDCYSPAIFTIAIGNLAGGPVVVTEQVIQTIDTDDVTVVANAPEPSSILLMSTGVLSIGLFGAYRRRQILAVARPPTSANLR
jgi:hypothetical protein